MHAGTDDVVAGPREVGVGLVVGVGRELEVALDDVRAALLAQPVVAIRAIAHSAAATLTRTARTARTVVTRPTLGAQLDRPMVEPDVWTA